MPAVIGDGNTLVLTVLFDNIVGQSLRGLADRVDIHPVGAGSQNAAQTGSTELEIFIKALFDLVLVAFDGLQLCTCLFVEKRVIQPGTINVHILSHCFLLSLYRNTARVLRRIFCPEKDDVFLRGCLRCAGTAERHGYWPCRLRT